MSKGILSRGKRAWLAPGLLLAAIVGCRSEPQPGSERWEQLKQEIRDTFPNVQSWTVAELKAELDRGGRPLLLDVRDRAEFEVSHLPGAHWAPDVDAALHILAENQGQKPYIAYCSVGYRSARLAEELSHMGRGPVLNLEGSIFEWANAGYAVVRNEAEVSEVHPYDREWGELLERELWSALEPSGASGQ